MTMTVTPSTGRPGQPPPRSTRRGSLLSGLVNEVQKHLLDLVAGWRATMLQLGLFPLFFVLLVLFIGRGQLRSDLLVLMLIGLVPLVFVHEQVNRAFWGYLGEIQAGVLEQTYLTPLPSWIPVLGRQIAAAIGGLPHAAATYIVGIAFIYGTGGSMPVNIQVLVPLLALVVGTAGVAMIISGLTLVFKRIEILTETSVGVLIFLGGGLFPLSALPDWAATFSRLLVPVAPGIEAMREILINGRSLTTMQAGWGLGWLIVQPIILLTVSILLFRRMETVARTRGTLGRYA